MTTKKIEEQIKSLLSLIESENVIVNDKRVINDYSLKIKDRMISIEFYNKKGLDIIKEAAS